MNIKNILTVIASLIFVVAITEIALGVYFKLNEDIWVWQNDIAQTPRERPGRDKQPRMKLLPYFGQIMRPGWTPSEDWTKDYIKKHLLLDDDPDWWEIQANNYGFQSAYDYPYARKDNDELIIGIFGGSVARNLAVESLTHFQAEFERLFPNKKVILLNLAGGGYKQPQQLLILSYFLSIGQEFDYVINVDGFNEAWVGWYNINEHGISPLMPFAGFVYGLQNYLAGERTGAGLETIAPLLSRFSTILDRSHTATGHLFAKVINKTLNNYKHEAYNEFGKRRDGLNYATIMLKADQDYNAAVIKIAETWRNASIAMHTLLAKQGIRYVHAIQPNQYFTDREFSEAESKIAFTDNFPFKQIVATAYPLMLRESEALKKAGVDFIDATLLIRDLPGQIFSDNCCHFTKSGSDALIDFILESMQNP